ncbi:MAG: hypothetical protein ACLPWF_12505 [Bryobacteraceae bacterium]
MVHSGLVDQGKIKAGVQRAERALARDVVRIVYSYAPDWTGDDALFFRIVLRDAASAPDKLRQTTHRIEMRILIEIKAHELGLQTYFNYRSESEQAELREPAWER